VKEDQVEQTGMSSEGKRRHAVSSSRQDTMTRCICSEFILIPQSRYHRLSVDLILENERACRKIADNWTPYICLAITTSGAWSKTGRCFIDSWMPYISNRRSLLCRCGSSFRFSLFRHVHLPFETL